MDLTLTGQLVLVFLAAGLVAATAGAASRLGRSLWAPASLTCLLVAVAVAGAADPGVGSRPATALVVAVAGALALVGGGSVTTLVFDLVDRRDGDRRPVHGSDPADLDPADPDPAHTSAHAPAPGSLDQAGEVLRGGAWIGALERTAVFLALVGGWPEGVALVVALKGLGRYPELRAPDASGTAERFIIGTFTSLLWAVACAGAVLLVR